MKGVALVFFLTACLAIAEIAMAVEVDRAKQPTKKRLSFAESHGRDMGEEATQVDNGNGLTNHDHGASSTGDGDNTHDASATGRADGIPQEGCMPHCDSSCCYFSNPARECSKCKDDVLCHPGAECYEGGNKSTKATESRDTVPKKNEAGDVCQEWCKMTDDCCQFSHPKADCGGGDPASYGCAPGLECYETGLQQEEL